MYYQAAIVTGRNWMFGWKITLYCRSPKIYNNNKNNNKYEPCKATWINPQNDHCLPNGCIEAIGGGYINICYHVRQSFSTGGTCTPAVKRITKFLVFIKCCCKIKCCYIRMQVPPPCRVPLVEEITALYPGKLNQPFLLFLGSIQLYKNIGICFLKYWFNFW